MRENKQEKPFKKYLVERGEGKEIMGLSVFFPKPLKSFSPKQRENKGGGKKELELGR